MARAIDVSALTDPPRSLGTLTDADARQAATLANASRSVFTTLLIVIAGLLLVIAVITGFVRNDADDWAITAWFAVILVVACALIVGLRALVLVPRHRLHVRRFLLFCTANGLDATPANKKAKRSGVLFPGHGTAGSETYRATWPEGGRLVEAATYSWSTAGTRANSHQFAFVAFPCSTDLPHVLFENRHPKMGWDVAKFAVGPVVPSDRANEHGYRLSANAKDQDARIDGIFSDALVSILTDKEYPFNAEIIGGSFVAYYAYGQETDPGRWRAIFALSDAAVTALAPSA